MLTSVETVLPQERISPARRIWALYAVLFFFLALWLGGRGLNEPDEGRYVNIAQNFLLSGADIWEPVMSGFGHYDKPPLVYWSTACFLKIFGASEWSARLTPLLGAYLALLGLGWAAWRWHGREVAFWSVLICGTLGQFWLLARFLTPDMFMTGWCTLAVGAWAECRHRGGHWGFWTLSLLFWSLAWWSKATPCLVPLAGLALGLKMTGDREGWKFLRPARLVAGILVLGCPWYLVMMARHAELEHFFFGRELMGRVTGHVSGRKGPLYYYMGVSLIAWLPWWPLAALTAMRGGLFRTPAWRSVFSKLGREGWMAAGGLVVFSIISSKLPTYTLCLTPWVALLMARAVLHWRTHVRQDRFRIWIASIASGTGLCYLAAILLVPRFEGSLGANLSLRPLGKFLREKGADAVYFDRHWPGAEFYLGPTVYFVGQDNIQQREDDPGFGGRLGKTHFYTPESWRDALGKSPDKNVWVARYRRAGRSPFDALFSQAGTVARLEVGDFLLLKVR